MLFYLKRFSTALFANKRWTLIIPLCLIIYLAYAAVWDIKFSITQALGPYNPGMPVAVAQNPVETIALENIVQKPSLLFLEEFSLKQVLKKIAILKNSSRYANENQLSRFIHTSMSLKLVGQDHIDISFKGADSAAGKILVDYYSQRLLTRIEDGLTRSLSLSTTTGQPPELRGDISISNERSLWDEDRLLPLGLVVIFSTIFTMIFIGFIEFSNPAFKSEREMAEYLGIPVLGIVPNVDRIASSMSEIPSRS